MLLDILLTDTVKNGIIKAGLLWAKIGSQMKLVRFGSPLYSMALEDGIKKESKDIKNPDIGGVYENRKGEQFLYLGKVKTKKRDYVKDKTAPFYQHKPDIEVITDVSGQLWLGRPKWRKEENLMDSYSSTDTDYKTNKKTFHKYYFLNYYSEVVKSKSIIKKLEQTNYNLETFRGLSKKAILINEAILC